MGLKIRSKEFGVTESCSNYKCFDEWMAAVIDFSAQISIYSNIWNFRIASKSVSNVQI